MEEKKKKINKKKFSSVILCKTAKSRHICFAQINLDFRSSINKKWKNEKKETVCDLDPLLSIHECKMVTHICVLCFSGTFSHLIMSSSDFLFNWLSHRTITAPCVGVNQKKKKQNEKSIETQLVCENRWDKTKKKKKNSKR